MIAMIMPPTLHAGRLPKQLMPLLFVAYTCLLPHELNFDISGLTLFPYRVALLLALPFSISLIVRSPINPSYVDAFVVFMMAWFPISLTLSTSFPVGMETGLSLAFDYGLGYLIGRASIRSAEDMRLIFRYLLPGLIALVALMAVESISHRNLLRPILARILGKPEPLLPDVLRMGLLRAAGTFPHPILSGVYLAALLSFGWYLTHNAKTRIIAVLVSFGAIFTVSSVAVIGLFMAVALVVAEFIQRVGRIPIFPLAVGYLAVMLVGISLVSESGLASTLVRYLTFDSATGFYRMAIWDYGGAEVMRHPVIGIGVRDWLRPTMMVNDTVDAYWLLITMMHGFPALIGATAVMLGAMLMLLRSQRFQHPADRNVSAGILIFLVIAAASGFTVHYWEALNSWILVVVGCGVSLSTQAKCAPEPINFDPLSQRSDNPIYLASTS